MAVEDNYAAYVPPRTAYGRYIHERGTRNLILAACCLAVVWYAYSIVHTNLMMKVKWPVLATEPAGLTVVGLRDRDEPGWHHIYEARESNHSWQIRQAEDAPETADDESDSDGREKGSIDPGQYHHGNSGRVIPVETVLKTCPVVMVGSSFSGAHITEGYDEFYAKPYYKLEVDLTDEGRSRYWQFSHVHEKERIAFILGNQVIACPRMSNVDVSSLTIDPVWIKSDAELLCDFINKQKK